MVSLQRALGFKILVNVKALHNFLNQLSGIFLLMTISGQNVLE